VNIYEDENGTEYVLAEDADEIRNQMHLNAAKILSREAIIQSLSEDYNALLRVARAAKASFGDGVQYEFLLNPPEGVTVDTKLVALIEALKDVEHLL